MAYKMHNIKLSPKKCTFFPDELTILGVSFTPIKAELALDKLKAQSMLDWEKPDSLYTLQSKREIHNFLTQPTAIFDSAITKVVCVWGFEPVTPPPESVTLTTRPPGLR